MTCGLAFTACTVEDNPNPLPLGEPDPDEWEIDFVAMANKYAEWTATTISAEVYEGMGTCSIVDGTLAEPLEDGTTTFSEEYDQRFALQTGTNWRLHYDAGKELKGLYSQNGGGRNFGVLNAKKDQIITLVMTAQPTVNLGNVDLYSKTDSSYVYYVNEDCNVRFNVARYNYIKYVSVKKFYGAEYTVKFVNEKGEKVKDDVKHMGYINKPVSLMPGDIEPINLDGGGRLIFKEADNTEENVVKKDGSTVITVVYREAEKYYAILQCMAGSTLLERFMDENKYFFYEDDQLTIYPPIGYTKDGFTYFTAVNNNGGKYNGCEFTFPGNLTPTEKDGKKYYLGTMSYEKDETGKIYFSDIERLALPTEDAGNGTGLGQLVGTVNSWYSYTGGYFNRLSGARGIRLDANSYVWTEPIAEAGTYKVTLYGRNDVSAECDKPYVLGIRTGEEVTWLTDLTIPAWPSAATGENVVENVAIPAGSSLVIGNDGSTFDDGKAKQITLDCVTISKPAPAE